MTNADQFYSIFKNDYHNLEKIVKSFFKTYSKLYDFFHTLFHWIPIEFFVILAFTVVLLILINNVSPKSPKINFFISLAVTSGVVVLVNKFLLERFRLIAVAKADILIAVPVLMVFFISFYINLFRKQRRRKKLSSPQTIETAVMNIQMTYNETMIYAHKLLLDNSEDVSDLKEKLNYLKVASEGFLSQLEDEAPKQQAPTNT